MSKLIIDREDIFSNEFIEDTVEKVGNLVESLMPSGPSEANVRAMVSLVYHDLLDRYNLNKQ